MSRAGASPFSRTISTRPFLVLPSPVAGGGASSNNGSPVNAADPAADPAADGSTTAVPVTPPLTTVAPTLTPVGADIGYAAQSQFVALGNLGVSVTDSFTKRSSVTANFGMDQTQVFGQARIETRGAGLQITHRLTRKLGVHVGYTLQESRYFQESSPNTENSNHYVDFGIDYGDGGSISFARYYTLTFSVGHVGPPSRRRRILFRLDGGATLARSIGRTWAASIGAARGTSYILGF